MTKRKQVGSQFVPPYHRLLGAEVLIGEDGTSEVSLTVDPAQHYGGAQVHGGVFAALADSAAGTALSLQLTPGQTISGTVELKINYLTKVYEGRLVAEGRVVRAGKRIAVCDVDVMNDGRLAAKALVTLLIEPGDLMAQVRKWADADAETPAP